MSVHVATGDVVVSGDLDRRYAHRFSDAVAVLQRSPAPRWSVDVSEVTFCDVEGLRTLLAARDCADRAGRAFAVTHPRPWLRSLLSLVGLGPGAVAPAARGQLAATR
jgi:anti-anti-sigma factor